MKGKLSPVLLLFCYIRWSKLIFKEAEELGRYGRNGKKGRMAGTAQGQQHLGGLGRVGKRSQVSAKHKFPGMNRKSQVAAW